MILEGDDSISRLLSSLKTAPKTKTINVAAVATDETNFNPDRDLNIRCNYENFTLKPEEKILNIVYVNFVWVNNLSKLKLIHFSRIPKADRNESLVKRLGGDVAGAVSPGKASSSGEFLGKNYSSSSIQNKFYFTNSWVALYFISGESNMLTEEIKRTVSEIPFHELEKATNSWNENNILGKGGFGTVYVGEWKETKVAVKVFKKVIKCNFFEL